MKEDEVIVNSKKQLGEKIVSFIEERLKDEHPESQLIAVLHRVQEECGYLSKENLESVAQLMQIPAAKVSGVASFYHYFRLKPSGKLIISVCTGTACHVKGADKVISKLKEELQIEFGQTSKDGLFTLQETRCLGACALAPVMKVGDSIHPQVTPEQIPAILAGYRQKRKEGKI